MSPARAGGEYVPIHDPGRLGAVLRTVGDAPKGISPAQWKRLRAGAGRHLRLRTLRLLYEGLAVGDARLAKRVADAIMGPELAKVLRKYTTWLRRSYSAVVPTPGDGNILGAPIAADIFRFQGQMRDAGHSDMRIALAIGRALHPLLQSQASGGIETSSHELSQADVRTFVRHGLHRERMLLRRPPARQRFEQLAKRR